ncbi:hypothetical protein [Clostridium sp. ZBS2]|uniref:hypothetical protein n=1 Tax=Clostridium sp. ZBS2 TaxID=2949976 RepID=UPI0020793016|nr:hypothetical protein [Clostridium sp. ZBS2]
MDFSVGNLVKSVVGAVAKVANAVVNKLSPVAKGGGILGGIAGAIVGVAEAVLGVTAEFANACEDGEIDDEEAEELLEDVFKLLVGAFIFSFGSGSSSTESKCDDSSQSLKGVNLNLEKRYISKKTYISGETYITKKPTGLEPIPEYKNDNIKLHSLPGEYKLEYLVKGVYDRTILPFKEHITFVGECYGLTPEYAELYGDFSVGMLTEAGITASISGIKSAKNIISGNFSAESEFIAGSGIGNLGNRTGKAIEDLSSKALKHPMNDHIVSRYVKQVPYQSKEVVEGYLSKKSFFNPSWTEEQVTNALNSAYKDAVSKGITDGYHTYKIYGEEINIFMREGKFSTGFGNHKFTYDEIINFGK